MKFHRLTLEGVGSFYERTTLDLDTLAESGLFLIAGKTGSGKSTILDGIVYALYGDVAGERESTTDRILSYYWDKDYPPEVVLVFSAHDKFYELQRTVTFTKPGRKTPVPSIAQLKVSDTSVFTKVTEPIATGKDVTKMVVEILGLEKSHFLQTVILPQGQIQQFLTAGAGQRHEVLSNLFGASNFIALEKAAKERASQGKETTAEYTRRLDELLTTAYADLSNIEIAGENETAWHDTLEEFAAAKDAAAQSISALDRAGQPLFASATKILCSETAQSKDAAEQAQEHYLAAQTELTKAETEQRVILEARQMADKLSQLTAKTTEIEQLDQRNQKALHANAVIDADDAAQEPYQSARHQRANILDTLAQLVDNDTDLARFRDRVSALSDTDLQNWLEDADFSPHLADLRDEISAEVNASQKKLETIKANLSLQREKTTAAHSKESKLESLHNQMHQLADNAKTTKATLDQKRQSLREQKSLADGLVSRQTELANVQELHEWAKSAEKLTTELKAAQENVASLQAHYDQAQENAASVLRKWSSTAASRLAARLKDGESCPVCGSRNHPHPAAETTNQTTFQDYEAAVRDAKEAQDRLTHGNETKTEINTKLQTATDQLQGRDVESLAADLAVATQALAAATAASEQVPQLEETIAALEESRERNQTEREILIQQEAGLSTEIKNLHADIQELADKIQAELAAFNPDSDPKDLLETNQLSLDTVKQLSKFYDSWLAIRQEWIISHAALCKSLTDHGFESVAEAQTYAKSRQQLETDQETVTSHHKAAADLRAKLDTDAYRDKAAANIPDLESLRAAVATSEQEYRSLTQRTAAMDRSHENLCRLQEKYAQTKQEWDTKVSEIAGYERLSQVLNGDNAKKTTLSAYYLSKRLGQVIFVANQLISDVSGGYYQIRHNDQYEADRNQKYHGLGIEMYNGAEDQVVPPKSLSGGEKFYCSLAIAMALSEVVQRERGGITLENIFIDEGFGSLDNDTREAVMSALHHLQQDGGRCVGIISHVSELQGEIPLQVQVRNYQSGNTTELKPGGTRKIGSYLQINGLDTF